GSGGVTYADRSILEAARAEEVLEIGGMKFISGSNLGLSLRARSRLSPFYSPPGARGEDAFLSTVLGDRKVMKIPTYVFHDGFLRHRHLVTGVLPRELRAVSSSDPDVVERFLNACIGWIRYKPLLTYVINRKGYDVEIAAIKEKLAVSIPRLCAYFGSDDFNRIPIELEYYHRHVESHFKDFEDSKIAWATVMASLENVQSSRPCSRTLVNR
ncbi:MAG TPA: hypothetical protein VII15_00685, partial [Candidatus Cryosericum sp.]